MKTRVNFINGLAGSLVLLMAAVSAMAQTNVGLNLQVFAGLSITGNVGAVHTIQYTTDLQKTSVWHCLAVVQLTNATHLFVDTTAPAQQRRVYRTVVGPTDLTWIPAGTFFMGSATNETGRDMNEGPQTLVTFTRGFFLGKRELTQAAYVSLMGTNPSAFAGDPTLPVETVSWPDAVSYCTRLTQAESAAGRLPSGWIYRLPSEAQWEYACRAGTLTRFSYGDDAAYTQLTNYAWYGDPTTGRTHAVGTRLPNPWGLYDMHGNVWEHCQDVMTYPGGWVIDPPLSSGAAKMTRGGSWHSLGPRNRSAARNPYDTVNREAWVGFRVALMPN